MVSVQMRDRAWLVWRPDGGESIDDAKTVYAQSAESAAEKWAENDDAYSADYSIVGGNDAEVCVLEQIAGALEEEEKERLARQRMDRTARRFRVTGEAQPIYYATEVSGEGAGA